MFTTENRAEWLRSRDGDDRQLTLPELETFEVTLVAYAEDAASTVIQFACITVDYAQIESPNVTLRLSTRPRM